MNEEFGKLDAFLGVADGTSYSVIVCNHHPREFNDKLAAYGICLDSNGTLHSSQYNAWKNLLKKAGLEKKYWKNPQALFV